MKNVNNLRFKRTLFVGLGGAGAKTLRRLKQDIKDACGELPKQVKFLLVDTNATDLANYRDFDNNEKICIAVREPYQRYQHDISLATHEFIPKQNVHSLLALERGAGQIRSNGHFAVIESQYSNKLSRVFRHTAEELENIDIKGETLERDPKIEVRVVFSLAGGTGSGTFLPISVIIRSAIKHCEISAYVYSATHFERFVEKSAKYSVMQNAYASIAELDYMMHFGMKDGIHEPIKFNFGPEENQHITQSNRPFEEVFYIDKITGLPTSDTVEFAYNELDRVQQNTADALFLASTNIISAHTGTVDNVRQKVMEGQFDVNDKFAWVSGFGLAELYLDPQSEDAPKVINAGKMSILARSGDCDLPEDLKGKIISSFMKDWDESQGELDGDPILKNFLTNDEIKNFCFQFHRGSKVTSEEYDENAPTLDGLLDKTVHAQTFAITTRLNDLFAKQVGELLYSLFDVDEYRGYSFSGAHGKNLGISISSVREVLNGIVEKLQASQNKIQEELRGHEAALTKAILDYQKFRDNNGGNQPVAIQDIAWYKKPFVKPTQTPNVVNTPTNFDGKLADLKAEALFLKYYCERDNKTINVISSCIKHVESVLKTLEHWQYVLKAAYTYGTEKHIKVENAKSATERPENKVEVQMLEVDDYRLSLDDIRRHVKDFDDSLEKDADTAKLTFDNICREISKKSGSLLIYLEEGLKKIEKKDNDQFNQDERTELQKAIDRLVDLATPCMQIDRHGYGERVKVDQFWYIMTDCGKDKYAGSKEERKKIENDSVGGKLKNLIERNALDEKVNLVHVSGWHNKAILYRVKAAVPPYFVEGVCTSECGGITLESCYEELKKTKRTYTPFCHETLRQKLENAITVLKPHDSTSDDIAIKHWVDFMIANYIAVHNEKNIWGECNGLRGVYTVNSQTLGQPITGDVLVTEKIYTLGGGNRVDAFNMFTRYCQTLIKDNEEYQEYISSGHEDKYYAKFTITPEDYLDKVLVEHYKFSKDVITGMPENNQDKILIRKELAELSRRLEELKEKELMLEKNESIMQSHFHNQNDSSK